MSSKELKITRIGNSRGVRLPADVLRRYAFTDSAIMTEGVDGILLRPKQASNVKMSWTKTAESMAASSENWSGWDQSVSDGLEDIPWDVAGVAEMHENYCPESKRDDGSADGTI
jgi:antitoxin component of MazEF toxin-antitoxin module